MPVPRPTKMVPLLIPAHMNQTMSSCIGWYFFVNMNVTGPNKVSLFLADPNMTEGKEDDRFSGEPSETHLE